MTLLNPSSRTIERTWTNRPTGLQRLWLAGAVALVLTTSYLTMAGLVTIVLATAEDTRLSLPTVSVVALAGWLGAHQVPLAITGASLTALPLGLTLMVVLLIAVVSSRVARRLRFRRPDQARSVILAMGLSHAVAGACVALLLGRGIPLVDAFLCCGFTASVSSAVGVMNRCGLVYLVWERVPAEIWSGLRVGLLGFCAAIGVGELVVSAAMLLSIPELHAVLARSGSLGDAVGETLLTLLYIPNAVLAGWSFTVGTGLAVGRFVLQPWNVTSGPTPELPLFSALPSSGPAWWWLGVFLLPVAVGVLIGWSCRNVHPDPLRRIRAVVVSATTASLGTLLLSGVAGGSVGGGVFDPITLRPVALAMATFCWIVVPAVLVAWFAGPRVGDDPDEAVGIAGDLDESASHRETDASEGNPDLRASRSADGELTDIDVDEELGSG